MKKGVKVLVGMSGGVDSSVSAALLKQEGYDVVGVFIKVWQADFLPCTWREERRDAMRVAAKLDIPFLTLNFEEEYKNDVVDYMIREYQVGRVPNPDVMCNKYVKFGAFLDFARAHGADYIATGHYARTQMKNNLYHLLNARDREKDQTYFLWTLTQKELPFVLFPIGHLEKSDVRSYARQLALPNAEKKDSQGLCFIGAVDMPTFLKHYITTEKGAVLDEKGNIIGAHEGALLYTIGQRHGFSTHKTSTMERPYFVVAKDMSRNTITVAHHDGNLSPDTGKTTIHLSGINNIVGIPFSERKDLHARIRHRGELLPVSFSEHRVVFVNPQEGIAPGQSVVFYANQECLGGGIVD